MKLIFTTSVSAIKEEFWQRYIEGVGKEAVFEKVSKGWFLHLDGSHEALFTGFDKPDIKIGSVATVTIEVP